MQTKVKAYTLFSQFDLDLFASGHHIRLHEKFGSHLVTLNDKKGVYFAVYAPSAKSVEVIGDFNHWNGENHELFVKWDGSGIWEGFIEGIGVGEIYKYRIFSNHDDKVREKADPYAQLMENPPKSASIVWESDYTWKDKNWLKTRKEKDLFSPICIYEVHLGSWKKAENNSRSLHYTELAKELVEYVKELGYTHVEFMPIMEHPYYPSWGYLCTGYFAPTSRYGNPDELRLLIDSFHEAGIGVLLDWVPAHFPNDEHALADFDGSALYEHPDKSKGFHPDWNSLIFNYERPQIRSFLLSSAFYWLDQFHADGLRVDAVASMLYLDYSRKEGEWQPNEFGGNEYLAAINFLKELNTSMYRELPDIHMIAEESTAFPGVTKPVHLGGLGFGLKWMMGWMNDSLEFFEKDPIYRSFHHYDISRSLTYAFSENYLLPLSHDEVVHGKQSMLSKMPGDDWQRFANLRLLYFCQYTHPGQKLLFMGSEFGQYEEWNVDKSLSWELLEYDSHKGLLNFIKDLNNTYTSEDCLFANNYSHEGFEWLDYNDKDNSIISFVRKYEGRELICVANFSPVVHNDYRIAISKPGTYKEIFNSDDLKYYGSGVHQKSQEIMTEQITYHGREHSMNITIPPLAGIILQLK